MAAINGPDEQERRATSALLAVMSAVREFGRGLTGPLGAPAGPVDTFIEVPFDRPDGKCIPDGLIRVRRGQRSWTVLVEVKTGVNALSAEQLETYLDVVREQGFDAVLTISNQIPAVPGPAPHQGRQTEASEGDLHHWSWSHILAEAVMQKEHRGVADPDQAWILGELIRHVEHPRSGALEFDDMGPAWVCPHAKRSPPEHCAPQTPPRLTSPRGSKVCSGSCPFNSVDNLAPRSYLRWGGGTSPTQPSTSSNSAHPRQ